jgi:hypothetical protein
MKPKKRCGKTVFKIRSRSTKDVFVYKKDGRGGAFWLYEDGSTAGVGKSADSYDEWIAKHPDYADSYELLS